MKKVLGIVLKVLVLLVTGPIVMAASALHGMNTFYESLWNVITGKKI